MRDNCLFENVIAVSTGALAGGGEYLHRADVKCASVTAGKGRFD